MQRGFDVLCLILEREGKGCEAGGVSAGDAAVLRVKCREEGARLSSERVLVSE